MACSAHVSWLQRAYLHVVLVATIESSGICKMQGVLPEWLAQRMCHALIPLSWKELTKMRYTEVPYTYPCLKMWKWLGYEFTGPFPGPSKSFGYSEDHRLVGGSSVRENEMPNDLRPGRGHLCTHVGSARSLSRKRGRRRKSPTTWASVSCPLLSSLIGHVISVVKSQSSRSALIHRVWGLDVDKRR